LVEQIVSIRNRCNQGTYKVSKDDLFAILMAEASMEYRAALVAEQRHRGNNLTLDDLREVMDTLCRQLYGNNGSHGEKDSKEVSISNFMGTCFTWKKNGHKASQNPKKKAKNPNIGAVKATVCGHCGKKGHNESSCWLKPENKNKAPAWIRGKLESNEVAAGPFEQNRLEVQLATNEMISFLSTMKLLRHPNIIIADVHIQQGTKKE
jgi:hypothetical protein